MRFLIEGKQKQTPPVEQLPTLVQALRDWHERYNDRFETIQYYAGGNGGFGIVNVESEAELDEIASSHPFSPYSEMVVRPLVDTTTALDNFERVIQQMAGQGSPTPA